MHHKLNLFIIFIIDLIISGFASPIDFLKSTCTLDADGKFYDLRSLSLKSGFKTIQGAGKTDLFHINICSQTNSFGNSTLCDKRTSICLVNGSDSYEIAQSRRLDKISLDDNNNLFLNFTHDNKAELFDPKCQEIQTSIKFLCNISRPLEYPPIFTGRTNCTLNFEWQTGEACADKHTIVEPHFKNESLVFLIGNNEIDLEPIFEPQTVQNVSYNASMNEAYDFVIAKNLIEYTNSKAPFNSQYTKDKDKCAGSFVCQFKKDRKFIRSIAKLSNRTALKYADDNFHLFVSSDSKCGRVKDGNTSAIFNMYCGKAKNITFVAENNLCHYIFDLYHPKVCEFEEILKSNKNPIVDEKNVEKTTEKPIERTTLADVITKKIEKPTTKSTTTISKVLMNSSPVDPKARQSSQTSNDSNSNTTLFGFIILFIVSVVGIVLAVVSLIDDDRRAWLQNRVRRVIRPQNATFHYSQVNNHSDSSRLVPLDQVDE